MNRLARQRLLTTSMCGIASTAVAAAGWWMLQPMVPASPISPGVEHSNPIEPGTEPVLLDASAFNQVLWHEPEAPVEPERPSPTTVAIPPPPPPPAAIALTLVAIVEEGPAWRVALYDPKEQRLVLAAEGESVGRVVVKEVTRDTVLLELAGRTQRLALEDRAP